MVPHFPWLYLLPTHLQRDVVFSVVLRRPRATEAGEPLAPLSFWAHLELADRWYGYLVITPSSLRLDVSRAGRSLVTSSTLTLTLAPTLTPTLTPTPTLTLTLTLTLTPTRSHWQRTTLGPGDEYAYDLGDRRAIHALKKWQVYHVPYGM